MEHLFHFFGGGCGEHMLIPGLASLGIALTMGRHYIKGLWGRMRRVGSKTTPQA